ncbi:YaiI/YqxD family protein [Anoxybacterium hadale]|uniref:YaiI/YqxD family protein n=1 Tax=Anoxybacterium hadale TaxID=3408580 RepID=A0ACD1A6H4_9FIRM|nr:YaiI/YqxD family protein [Clostridiales bacterium]
MKLLIDADGCPVVDIAVGIAKKHRLECLILCDTSHVFEKEGASTLVFSKGADSVDFALVNIASSGDIVITQDYGLAAMCLSKQALVLNQDGKEYTVENIDGLLSFRHTAKKIRNAGGRLKGPSKRTPAQDEAFKAALTRILSGKLT